MKKKNYRNAVLNIQHCFGVPPLWVMPPRDHEVFISPLSGDPWLSRALFCKGFHPLAVSGDILTFLPAYCLTAFREKINEFYPVSPWDEKLLPFD